LAWEISPRHVGEAHKKGETFFDPAPFVMIAFGSSMRKLRANFIPESIQKGDSSTVSRGQAKVTLSYGADED
jgi:hypothetical protein